MRKKAIRFSLCIMSTLLLVTLAGCKKESKEPSAVGSAAKDQRAEEIQTKGAEEKEIKNPHSTGALDVSDFPPFKDKTLIDQAVKKMSAMKSYKIINHVTEKRDGKTVGDTDFEVIYLAPDKVYFFGDDNVSGKRTEIFDLAGIEYQSFDGKKWTKKKKPLPSYSFLPKVMDEMFAQGKDFRLISKDRAEDMYKSCTVIIFERPSIVYPGQKQQVVVFIDNSTKNIVRIELLDNEKKPLSFHEEFLRFFDHDSPKLKIELPAEAKAVK